MPTKKAIECEMKITSIIGTRPQYIKIKPWSDYCETNGIQHTIVDTKQHFSHNVSDDLITDLDLSIDHFLRIRNFSEMEFICGCIRQLEYLLRRYRPDRILLFGDTNSAFSAALVAHRLRIPLAHAEAGERSGDRTMSEEANRIFIDSVADYNLCSSESALNNVERGWVVGDLEYEFLNNIDPKIQNKDFGLMTIHRASNTNLETMQAIFDLCEKIGMNIVFPVHHRTSATIESLMAPKNVTLTGPCTYRRMVKYMAECRFIITDSGSIQKTSPFFGKPCLVMRNKTEWTRTEQAGFARKATYDKRDERWVLSRAPERQKRFYLFQDDPTKLIYKTLLKTQT